jgi:hypothetical protein
MAEMGYPEAFQGSEGSVSRDSLHFWACKEYSHDQSFHLNQRRHLSPLAVEEHTGNRWGPHLDERDDGRLFAGDKGTGRMS